MEPHEVRLANLVQPSEMPYDNITKKHFDSGDYPEAVRRAAELASSEHRSQPRGQG